MTDAKIKARIRRLRTEARQAEEDGNELHRKAQRLEREATDLEQSMQQRGAAAEGAP